MSYLRGRLIPIRPWKCKNTRKYSSFGSFSWRKVTNCTKSRSFCRRNSTWHLTSREMQSSNTWSSTTWRLKVRWKHYTTPSRRSPSTPRAKRMHSSWKESFRHSMISAWKFRSKWCRGRVQAPRQKLRWSVRPARSRMLLAAKIAAVNNKVLSNWKRTIQRTLRVWNNKNTRNKQSTSSK